MRLPRFRIRTMMVVVAVVALLTACAVGAWRLNRLSRYYQARAAEAAFCEDQDRIILDVWQDELADIPKWHRGDYLEQVQAKCNAQIDPLTKRIEYFVRLKQKYGRAASHPWEHVAPDAPEPPLPE